MDLSQSAALVNSIGGIFEWLPEVSSTNSLLIERADAPHFSVIATDNQVAGRGRSGRVWQAPAGGSLAVSVLLRPNLNGHLNQLGWLPLLAGLAMSRVVSTRLPESQVGIKWPNDVLVSERKISGVLTELLPDAKGVVIGAGLNLTLSQSQLPVPTATSLLLEGAAIEPIDSVLNGYLKELFSLYEDYANAHFDAQLTGLAEQIASACSTIGRQVKAVLPGDREEFGKAVAIDESGRLVIEQDSRRFAVAAGDIVHMRHN